MSELNLMLTNQYRPCSLEWCLFHVYVNLIILCGYKRFKIAAQLIMLQISKSEACLTKQARSKVPVLVLLVSCAIANHKMRRHLLGTCPSPSY
jgi:hypothetical protein